MTSKRAEVDARSEELEDEAFRLAEAQDQGPAEKRAYLAAFKRARAAQSMVNAVADVR